MTEFDKLKALPEAIDKEFRDIQREVVTDLGLRMIDMVAELENHPGLKRIGEVVETDARVLACRALCAAAGRMVATSPEQKISGIVERINCLEMFTQGMWVRLVGGAMDVKGMGEDG